MTKTKSADEVFCRSCGEAIKKEAEICPECGVRNKKHTPSRGRSPSAQVEHDPSQFETTVSEKWHYGVAASMVLWIVVLAATGVTESAFMGFVVLVAWVLMPLAIYFDSKYVRANSRWNPNTVAYVVGSAVWLVNIIVGIVYLYRRHEVLEVP